jgi:hypothetical protein
MQPLGCATWWRRRRLAVGPSQLPATLAAAPLHPHLRRARRGAGHFAQGETRPTGQGPVPEGFVSPQTRPARSPSRASPSPEIASQRRTPGAIECVHGRVPGVARRNEEGSGIVIVIPGNFLRKIRSYKTRSFCLSNRPVIRCSAFNSSFQSSLSNGFPLSCSTMLRRKCHAIRSAAWSGLVSCHP